MTTVSQASFELCANNLKFYHHYIAIIHHHHHHIAFKPLLFYSCYIMFLAFVVLSLKLKTCTRAAHDFSGMG